MQLERHPLLFRALASMMAAQALVVFASLAVPIMAPLISRQNNLPPGLIGAYSSLIFLGAILAALLSPALVARFGSVRVSQATLLLAAAGLAVAASTVLVALIVSALALGLAYGPANPASSTVLRRVTTPDNRARVFSAKQTSVPLGGVLAGLLIPWLEAQAGWLAVVSAGTIILLGATLALERVRHALDVDQDAATPLPHLRHLLRPLGYVLSRPGLRQLAFMSCAFAAVQFTFSAVCVTVLVAQGGLGLVIAGGTFSGAMALGFVVRILSGFAADRFGGTTVLAAFATVMIAGTAAMAAVTPQWPIWASIGAALCLGAGSLSWNGVYLAEVANRAADGDVATATAGCMVMTFLGGLLGPALFAAAALMTGDVRLPMAGVTAFAVSALAVALRLRALDRATAQA